MVGASSHIGATKEGHSLFLSFLLFLLQHAFSMEYSRLEYFSEYFDTIKPNFGRVVCEL